LGYNLGSHRAEAHLRRLLLVAVGAGVVLRFVRLGGQSLWVDEVITLKNSSVGGPFGFSELLGNLQGPLVSFVMHFWAAISSNDAFLRVPFAVAGALTVLGIYLLAKSLCDSWTTLHTVFVASLSPLLVWYSQEVRGYAFAVLASVLMTYSFIQWLARPTARNGIYYGALLFAGLISNLSVAFVACAHLVYMLVTSTRRKLVGRWIVTVFVVLLVFSPWVREIIVRSQPQRALEESAEPLIGGGGVSGWTIPYSLYTYSVGYTLGPSVRAIQAERAGALAENGGWVALACLAFGIPLVLGISRLARSDRNLLTLLVIWLVVPLVAATVLAAGNVKVFNVRYALVAIPAYILLVGRGLAAISRSRFWPFVLFFTAVMGISLFNYFYSPAYGKEDARATARAIRAAYRPGDVVVGVYTAEALEHYLKGLAPVEVYSANDLGSRSAMEAKAAAIAAGGNRVWLSLCRDWMVDPRGYIKAWFDGNLQPAGNQVFPGFKLYLYEKRSQET
jgi:4-amino-4-deoxy-L-arabinose transferase-like glycosyltransferase